MNLLAGQNITRKISYFFKRLVRNLSKKERLRMFGPPMAGDADYIEAAYIINLDRQKSRWENFTKEAKRQRVEGKHNLMHFCSRISAVDGKELNLDDCGSSVEKTYPLHSQYYVDPDPRLLVAIREKNVNITMTQEEIAVALSHIKTWQRIIDEKLSYALILEDDVFFEKTFASQLNQSWQELPEKRKDGYRFDLLYLSYREVDRGAHKTDFSPNLHCPIRGYWWLSGYVLSYSGAQQLLDALPVVGPVDLWVNHIFSKLDVYLTPISGISQRLDLQSDNQYSILPLLSQIGIQSDKTHLILEQTKGRHPVFAIGFDLRGANILESTLSLLGYRCCNDKWGQLTGNIKQLIDKNQPLLFDGYMGTKIVDQSFKQLDALYPSAVFLLPPKSLESNKLTTIQHEQILSHFANRKRKLLTINICQEENWKKLCTFLSCSVPTYPFPENKQTTNISYVKRKTRDKTLISERAVTILEQDVHPWVVPAERLSAFGIFAEEKPYGTRLGIFKKFIDDGFSYLDESKWIPLEDSFPANLATFQKDNIILLSRGGFSMTLKKQRLKEKNYSSASLTSKKLHKFGRYEVVMKPAKAEGVVTAFFLHRTNPWQEIDIEILGKDTTKLLINVYFNPGKEGTNCNYGNRGTPVIINLNFDAADDYHQYAIEWEPHEMRWYVDDELIHVRSEWQSTPIPNLPMGVYCSIWPPRSTELAGELSDNKLPISSYVERLKISSFSIISQEGKESQEENSFTEI